MTGSLYHKQPSMTAIKMKKLLLLFFLLLGAGTLSAQSNWAIVSDARYKSDVRQKLRLDYSMPDYQTDKIDPQVMGPRLAKILEALWGPSQKDIKFSILSKIQSQQIEGLDYCTINKVMLDSVSKSGNMVTIHLKTTLDKNPLNIKDTDLLMSFVDGVSENRNVNTLFTTIDNYVKE